jgi:hypothetical protein
VIFQRATLELGLSPLIFYDLTPKELLLMFKYKNKKKCEDMEELKRVIAISVASAMNGKDYQLYEKEHKTKTISKEEKNETLSFLKDKFSRKEE